MSPVTYSSVALGGLLIALLVLAGLVVAAVMLFRGGPHRLSPVAVILTVLVLVAGAGVALTFFGVRVETAERARAQARAEVAAARAREAYVLARATATEPGAVDFTIVRHVPEIESINRDLLQSIQHGPRYQGGRILVGAYATQVYPRGTEPPQPSISPNNPDKKQRAALEAAVEERIISRLANYLGDAQRGHSKAADQLRFMSNYLPAFANHAEQRAFAARLIAEVPIGRNQTVVARDRTTGETVRYQAREVGIEPELIRQLAGKQPTGPRNSTWAMIIGLPLLLIVAGYLLRAATRRHLAVRTVRHL